MIAYITSHTQRSEQAVKNTVKLLEEDCTITVISRYRKEVTGNRDEVQIGEIVKYKELFEAFEKRKKAILKILEESEMLTKELADQIGAAQDLVQLEDLYLPFKKKRQTKAETAKK